MLGTAEGHCKLNLYNNPAKLSLLLYPSHIRRYLSLRESKSYFFTLNIPYLFQLGTIVLFHLLWIICPILAFAWLALRVFGSQVGHHLLLEVFPNTFSHSNRHSTHSLRLNIIWCYFVPLFIFFSPSRKFNLHEIGTLS